MPHAAMYAIVDSGHVRLSSSTSGALSIPRLAMSGPIASRKSIRELPQRSDWLSNEECEGGMLLDCNMKTLLLFGGDEIGYQRALQRTFTRMLAGVWPGWRVQWAHRGVFDLAKHVGVALRYCRRSNDSFLNRAATGDADCWISLRTTRGAIVDALLDTCGHGPAMLTPNILPAIETTKTCDAPQELAVNCGALVDCRERTVVVWDSAVTHDLAAQLRRRWLGWTVTRQFAGWRRQMRDTGRSRNGLAANSKVLERWIRTIVASRSYDGASLAHMLSQLQVATLA